MDILYRSGGDLAGWAGEEPVHDEKIIARPQEDGGWSCIFNQGFRKPPKYLSSHAPRAAHLCRHPIHSHKDREVR